MKTLAEALAAYEDTPECHRRIWDTCLANVQATPFLKAHRDFVEEGGYGYGERPFHWLWKLLVDEMPDGFKALEIGVFQGQVLSLLRLCADQAGKACSLTGITPLSSEGDLGLPHPEMDYLARIRALHARFGLKAPTLIKGLSFDPRVQHLAEVGGPYDLIYVDGCHDYHVALDDLRSYAPMLKLGGYLVIDDAACDLQIPNGLIPQDWTGMPQVTDAKRVFLEDAHEDLHGFAPVFSVGHVVVLQRR
jgi:hypothetical protein